MRGRFPALHLDLISIVSIGLRTTYTWASNYTRLGPGAPATLPSQEFWTRPARAWDCILIFDNLDAQKVATGNDCYSSTSIPRSWHHCFNIRRIIAGRVGRSSCSRRWLSMTSIIPRANRRLTASVSTAGRPRAFFDMSGNLVFIFGFMVPYISGAARLLPLAAP